VRIADDEKPRILLGLLQERYSASHKIRERSDRFTILALGWAAAGIWFLVRNGHVLTSGQRVALTVVVVAFGALLLLLQRALNRGFNLKPA